MNYKKSITVKCFDNFKKVVPDQRNNTSPNNLLEIPIRFNLNYQSNKIYSIQKCEICHNNQLGSLVLTDNLDEIVYQILLYKIFHKDHYDFILGDNMVHYQNGKYYFHGRVEFTNN